jgi:hypothetical protein
MPQAITLDPGTVNTKMLLAGWGRIGMDVGRADDTYNTLVRASAPGGGNDGASLSGAYLVGGRGCRWVRMRGCHCARAAAHVSGRQQQYADRHTDTRHFRVVLVGV